MATRLTGKTAIVTGGAAGIGAAIVRRLVAEGARVTLADLNEEAGHALARDIGPAARFVRTDVTSTASVQALVDDAVAAWGGLDILCNNAGIAAYGTTLKTSDDTWRQVMSVDLDSVFFCCRAALPHLIASGSGAIVNTASMAGMGGFANMAAYSAAKGAVINYTRTLALDHAAEGVRANAVCPGLIMTNMTTRLHGSPEAYRKHTARIPLQRAAQPEEVAAVVAFLASPDASFMTGCILPVDGGVSCSIRQRDVEETRW